MLWLTRSETARPERGAKPRASAWRGKTERERLLSQLVPELRDEGELDDLEEQKMDIKTR